MDEHGTTEQEAWRFLQTAGDATGSRCTRSPGSSSTASSLPEPRVRFRFRLGGRGYPASRDSRARLSGPGGFDAARRVRTPSKELAIFYIIAVACFVVAAFAGTSVGRRAGGRSGSSPSGLPSSCSRPCGTRSTLRSENSRIGCRRAYDQRRQHEQAAAPRRPFAGVPGLLRPPDRPRDPDGDGHERGLRVHVDAGEGARRRAARVHRGRVRHAPRRRSATRWTPSTRRGARRRRTCSPRSCR